MLPPTDYRFEQYTTAIEMNNIGVDLLEARSYRSSMRTLREAIEIMKSVVRPGALAPSEPCSTSYSKTSQSLLHDANLRLKEAQAQIQFAQREDAVEALCSMGTPLRIESAEMQTPDGRNPDLSSAVLLYNFGLVHRWAGCEQENANLREGSLRLFKMAFSILSERNTLQTIDPEDMSETKLFLLIVVLNSLVQLQEEMGKHSEASFWMQQLVRLGRVALNQEEAEAEEPPTAFAPAA